MANRRFIDFPIASTVGDSDIILIWQSGLNKQTTKATFLSGLPENLDELNDVTISGLTNGQILRYDSVTGKWENTDQGNLDLNDLNDVSIVSPSNGQVLVYNSSTSKWENSSGGYVPYTGAVTTVNLGAQTIQAGQFVKAGGTSAQFLKADGSVDSTAYGTGSVTSVALTMPSAFNVANSPITTAGTLAVTGAGTVGQYIRGDGSLADFPQASGGGSSVSYYLNGSISQGTIGGVAYKELNKVPILGAGTDFTINADGYIASFLTDAGDPNLLEIPGGNWNFETYFSASSSGGTPTFYVELYKYDGTTFTLIASSSSSPELIAFGTNLNPYFSTLAVPTTTLALTDRLAVRYYVTHSGRTITLHTENNHLCQVVTTFTTGLTSLNGLTAQVQNLAVGTSGTDFNIASATATHTFNLPTASATNRGALSSADWSTFNSKIAGTLATGQVAFGTAANTIGGDNGLFWDNTNKRLGIGTTTPLSPLHVVGDIRSTGDIVLIGGAGTPEVQFFQNSGNWKIAVDNDAMQFIDSTAASERWRITSTGILQSNGAQTIQTSSGALTLQPTGGVNLATSSGNVGIGTATPLAKLQINSEECVRLVNDVSFISFYNSANTVRTGFLQMRSASTARLFVEANQPLLFGTNSTEAIRIFSGQNVHIGPTPAADNGARLQVSGTGNVTNSTSGNALIVGSTYAGGRNIQIGISDGSILPTASAYINDNTGVGVYIGDNSASTKGLYVKYGGNVGIGTASPGYDGAGYGTSVRYFTVNSASNTGSNLELATGTTSNDGYVGAVDFINTSNTGAPGAGRYGIASIRGFTTNAGATNTGGGYLTFQTKSDGGSGAERMRLSSIGNLLIGTTTDNGAKLQVSGSATIVGPALPMAIASTNATELYCEYRYNTSTVVGYIGNGTGLMTGGGDANFGIRAQNSLVFSTLTTERMRITSAGIVDIAGPLVVRGTLPADQTDAAVIDHFSNTMRIFSYGAAGVTGDFQFRTAAGGAGSNLVSTINGTTGAYTAVSDINKKKDFEESTIGLNAILGLKPTLYRMKSEINTQKHLGFIAQEVKQYIPNAYVENGDFIGLNEMPIIAALTKAIQELKQEIDTLKN